MPSNHANRHRPACAWRTRAKFPPCLLTLLLLATGTGANEPHAPTAPAESLARTISLADLKLDSEAGQRAAQARIAATARILCRRMRDTRRIDDREAYGACQADAIADAMRRLEPFGGDPLRLTTRR